MQIPNPPSDAPNKPAKNRYISGDYARQEKIDEIGNIGKVKGGSWKSINFDDKNKFEKWLNL